MKDKLIELLRRSIVPDMMVQPLAEYLVENGVEMPVRCKDCVHGRQKNKKEKLYLVEDAMICMHPEVSEESWVAVFGGHWCSYGERREDK